MSKAIFIGLGGSGIKAVGHLKAKLLQKAGSVDALNASSAFIFIDTDSTDRRRLEDLYGRLPQLGQTDLFIPQADFVDLGGTNPWATWKSAEAQVGNPAAAHLLSWLDPAGVRLLKNNRLADGAGGNRQQGRVALAQNWAAVGSLVNQAFNRLAAIDRASVRPIPTVYVFSGTCGGTGSSAVLDLLYLLRVRQEAVFPGAGNIPLRLALFMPNAHVERYRAMNAPAQRITEYQANAHALFAELDEILAQRRLDGDGTLFGHACAHPQPLTIDFEPFGTAFCIDNRTGSDALIPEEALYRNTADFFYHWHLGDGAPNSLMQAVDNLSPATNSATRKVAAFSSFGFRALCFPGPLLDEYLRVRFTSELFDQGLRGLPYDEALPDPSARTKEVKEAFDECIGGYLFGDAPGAGQGLPNLAVKARSLIDQFEQSIVDDRFRVVARVAYIGPERERVAKDAVKDEGLVDSFIRDAAAAGEQLAQKLDLEFRTSETSLDAIVRWAAVGRQAPNVAWAGLEDWIEDVVLRFGLRATIDFASRLDTYCASRISDQAVPDDLEEQRVRLWTQIGDCESRIQGTREDCLRTGDPKHLEALLATLRERLRARGEHALVLQQIKVLQALCGGEAGVIDVYVRRLRELLAALSERIDGERGWQDAYYHQLPKRFAETAKDVTTTYLPDVTAFVEAGTWLPDGHPRHLFAKLYAGLVPSSERGPLRHGPGGGRDPDHRGLQRILETMLADVQVTLRPIPASARAPRFFRETFGLEGTKQPGVLLSELEEFADRHLTRLASSDPAIAQERGLSLANRVKALNTDEQRALVSRFTPNAASAFCPMSTARPVTAHVLFRGDDPALAQALGWQPGSPSHAFDRDADPTRFLVALALTGHELADYASAKELEGAYARWQAEAALGTATTAPFTPHLHVLLNRFGVRHGFEVIRSSARKGQSNTGFQAFDRLYLYRAALAAAKSANAALVDAIVAPSSAALCPFVMEPDPAGGYSGALYHSFDVDEHQRVRFRAEGGASVPFKGVRSHWDLWQQVSAQWPAIQAAANRFHAIVRPRLHEGLSAHFEKAISTLTTNVSTGTRSATTDPSLAQMLQFYSNLGQALGAVADDLRQACQRPDPGQQPIQPTIPAAGSPDVPM